MAILANPIISARDLHLSSPFGFSMKPSGQCLVHYSPMNLSLHPICQRKAKAATSKSQFTIRAGYRDDGRPSSSRIFVGGFLLGGLIVGALGCVYAPQISKALAGTDRKDLMRKLPKFIYDEEKALEKTRKTLEEKIAQLNSAIDNVSSQLRADDEPNGTVDGVEAAV